MHALNLHKDYSVLQRQRYALHEISMCAQQHLSYLNYIQHANCSFSGSDTLSIELKSRVNRAFYYRGDCACRTASSCIYIVFSEILHLKKHHALIRRDLVLYEESCANVRALYIKVDQCFLYCACISA